MNIQNSLKLDDQIFKQLDLKTINRLICTTDKGVLSLQIRKGEQNYHLCLDSVPVEKELNKTLMDLLFPIPKMEVLQVKKDTGLTYTGDRIIDNTGKTISFKNIIIKKKIGRPRGVKDGRKDME